MKASTTARCLVLVLVVLAVGILLWRPWAATTPAPIARDQGAETDGDPASRPPEPATVDQRASAYQLQAQRDWCAAQKAWESVLENAAADSTLRQEAQKNLELVGPLCAATQANGAGGPYVDKLDLEQQQRQRPEEDRPRAPPRDQVLAFYQPGKQVLSDCYLHVTGSGENRNWLIKGQAHFAYQYQVAVRTDVVANDGASVDFEQTYLDVVQNLAQSREELELNLPEAPLLGPVAQKLEPIVSDLIPQYRAVKRLAEITLIADPGLKRTLTSFHQQMKQYGVQLTSASDVALITQIDELAGMRLRIRYVPGLGVTFVEVLDGKRMDQGDLTQLAFNSSLFMDYFVSEAASRKINETWELRTKDVGGLVNLRYDTQIDGKMILKKLEDAQRGGSPLQVLEAVGGEAAVAGLVDGAQRQGTLLLTAGQLRYDPVRRYVQSADLQWEAKANWSSRDSLLFGTEKFRNVKTSTAYRARIADNETPEPSIR